MAVFTCVSCSKTFKAPDSLAGKKVACPSCKTVGTVPVPASLELAKVVNQLNATTAAVPPANRNAAITPVGSQAVRPSGDSVIADLLAEEKSQEEASRESTIKFECTFCSEPVEVGLELAGKRHPCPSCSRIVQIPVPKVQAASDWRRKSHFSSAVKTTIEKGPEGAWDVSTSKGVSREALEEADALPVRPVKKVPLGKRLRSLAMVLVFLGLSGLVGWKLMSRRAVRLEVVAVDSLLLDAEKDTEFIKNKLLLSSLEIIGAEAFLVATTEPDPEKARKFYSSAFRFAKEAAPSSARDMVFGHLAVSIASKLNSGDKSGRKLLSEDGHRLLRESVALINEPDLQLDTWQQVSDILVREGEANRLAALARQIFGSLSANQENRNREKINMPVEGLAIAGLALFRQGTRNADSQLVGMAGDLASEVLKRLDSRSIAAESGVALVVATEKQFPGTWNEAKRDAELWGMARGRSIQGRVDEADKIAAGTDGDQVDRLRAKVAATLGIDPFKSPPADILDLAVQVASSRPLLASTLLRLGRYGEVADWPEAGIAAMAQSLATAPAGSVEAEIRAELLLIAFRLNQKHGGPPLQILGEERSWSSRTAARREVERSSTAGGGPVGAGYFAKLGRLLANDSK